MKALTNGFIVSILLLGLSVSAFAAGDKQRLKQTVGQIYFNADAITAYGGCANYSLYNVSGTTQSDGTMGPPSTANTTQCYSNNCSTSGFGYTSGTDKCENNIYQIVIATPSGKTITLYNAGVLGNVPPTASNLPVCNGYFYMNNGALQWFNQSSTSSGGTCALKSVQ